MADVYRRMGGNDERFSGSMITKKFEIFLLRYICLIDYIYFIIYIYIQRNERNLFKVISTRKGAL